MLLNQVEGLSLSDSAATKLLPFAIEASWVTGKWERLKKYLGLAPKSLDLDFSIGIGSALLSLQERDSERFTQAVQKLRTNNAKNLSITTTASLQACHEAMLRFHVLAEVEAIGSIQTSEHFDRRALLKSLDRRLEVLGALFSDKQYLLGLRRATMQLSP